MGCRPTEAQLGKLWRARMEDQGWWVLKLPASSLAGVPDYLVGRKGEGFRFVEAKRTLATGKWAFKPTQLTVAQRFFLDLVADAQPSGATVLILDEEGYLELTWRSVGNGMTRRQLKAVQWRWDSGCD